MKYSDVLEKHIYTVDFNPVRNCEFNDKHLAVVLKKNIDIRTVIVVPLTKSSNGEGVNKCNIGKIASLPNNLKNTDSFVVYNQVRTVNCNRLYALKDDSNSRINANVDDTVFDQILSLCLDELSDGFSIEGKLDYYLDRYIQNVIETVTNIAYDIKRLTNTNKENNKSKIKELQLKIVSLLSIDIGYNKYIKDIDKENGIDDIIEQCLRTSLIYLSESKTEAI